MSGEKFAQLLTEAVYRIRGLEGKTVRIVQDELGYAIGKKGGASVEHWRKGFIPSKFNDIEQLARAIVQRSDLQISWLKQFLQSANYPDIERLCTELFPANGTKTKPPLPPSSPALTTPLPTTNHADLLTTSYIRFHNNLPPQLTRFVGREKELEEIGKYLYDPTCRLLTLTGMGGIGKTRLAIEAASNALSNSDNDQPHPFLNGVCFVPLASLSSTDFLASTIADMLGFTFFSGEGLEGQLLSYLQDKKMLFIVDNVEHLIQEVELLGQILRQAPDVKMIATSRERLNLRGEWVMEVVGMQIPDGLADTTGGATPQDIEDTAVSPPLLTRAHLEQYSATRLFLQNAIRSCSDFDPTLQDIFAIIKICRLVEGIPLAIELAATWVRVISCEDIAQEIETSYEFLATSWRDVPERHRSLQAVFDYSWNLLAPDEQETIRKLSVFSGGFQREAAVQVAGASLQGLSTLVDKSFLYRQKARLSGVVRYEMHDLLRQYATEKLNEYALTHGESEREKLLAEHCHYFAVAVYARQEAIKGWKQLEILQEMSEEIENIRAGWRWAVTQSAEDELNLYFEALYQFYDILGWVEEGEEVFRAAMSLENQGNRPLSASTALLYARIVTRRGNFCHRLGSYEKAQRLLNKSLTIFRKYNAQRDIAFAIDHLGNSAYRLGQHQKAKELCQESLAIYEAIGYQPGMAEALQKLGNIAEVQGEYQEAKRLHLDGLKINEAIGHRRGTAISLYRLGFIDWRLGELEEARQRCQQSLAICKEIGDRRGIAMSHKNLGNVACDLNEYHIARRHYKTGLRISKEIGDRWGIAAFYTNLGDMALQLGDYYEARKLCEKSLTMWREIGYRVGVAISLETLGSVAKALDEDNLAWDCFAEAVKISIELSTPTTLHSLTGLASLAGKQGHINQAVETLIFARNHPASDQETQLRIKRYLPELAAQLPPERLTRAERNAQTHNLTDMVEKILQAAYTNRMAVDTAVSQ